MKRLLFSALLFLLCAVTSSGWAAIDYNRQIRPILAANCFACHGLDEHARKAKLRLDQFESATAIREGSQAIAPGNPGGSELIRRVTTADEDDVMPPLKSGKKLSAAEVGLLKQWIAEGARYEAHWSFAPLDRPPLPKVQQAWRLRNEIDSFILSRLEKTGLKPEKEADRRILIRRVTLDLTGLPPSLAEVEAFLADKSPQAYEKVVDRLLASQRFGEHWARMWLDLARYADTKGYEKDQARMMWRYRDWVIKAFNEDMPYDEFTRQQLAGDLLPNATPDQLLATAFHRNTMTNDEGGTDDEEFRTIAVKDRVDTTAQVWMGLTMGCAKCHSHKYDPITLQEYYSFYALFNQTQDADRGDDFPTVPMPTAAQQQEKADLERRLAELEGVFWQPIDGLAQRQTEWERGLVTNIVWTPLQFRAGSGSGGTVLTSASHSIITASGPFPETETNIIAFAPPTGRVTALRLEVLEPEGRKGPGRHPGDRNVVISEFEALSNSKKIELKNARADFSQEGWTARQAIDGDVENGWAFSPEKDRPHVLLFDLAEPAEFAEELTIRIVQRFPKLQLEHFRLSFSVLKPALLKPELTTIAELAAMAPAKRSEADRKRLEEAFRHEIEPTKTVDREIRQARGDLKKVEEAIAKTPVMRELAGDKRRKTSLHKRGNFLDPGEQVGPGLPAAFGGAMTVSNRLGVADWLVSRNHPLTARVAANRAWARLFGVGLVETEEDFGLQGAAPSHPELLDWLAVEFAETHQWSWKKLLKTLVLSATYRQSSQQDPAKLKQDPRNLLLSRASRIRLSAEALRDQALAAAGLLSAKIGGPSVMPPQPEGIWRAVYSGLKWKTAEGEDRYRRALYTFMRRTSPYPSLTTFDAGSGEVCLVRRIRTNTPLQALVTLNDPAFFEAAGALGLRMRAAGKEGIPIGWQSVLARPPRPSERARLEKLWAAARAEFTAHPSAAKDLLRSANLSQDADSELAAWVSIGNVILNLDETLTRP